MNIFQATSVNKIRATESLEYRKYPLLFFAMFLSVIVSFANDNVYVDKTGVKYAYEVMDNDEIKITRIVPVEYSTADIVIPDSISGYSVTEIGNNPFVYSFNYEFCSITLPNTVKVIGDYAFRNLPITSIELGSSLERMGVNAFGGSSLISVELPNSLTSIEKYAFYNCKKLKNVTIPESVTSIRESAFMGCSELESVSIPSSCTSIETNAFSGCGLRSVIIPGDIDEIEFGTFGGCTELSSVTFLGSVSKIGEFAFADCKSLSHIELPESVTYIDGWAFRNTGLTSIGLGSSLKYILGNVFEGTKLTTFVVPENVQFIGSACFKNCKNLTSITIPGTVTTIWDSTFAGCDNLSKVNWNKTDTSRIYSRAFAGTKLTSFDLERVKQVGSECFIDTPLESVEWSSRMEGIGDRAFFGTHIKNVELGNAKSLGEEAFGSCNELEAVSISTVVPPSLHMSTFPEEVYKNVTLVVPDHSLYNYRASAVWECFDKIINTSGLEDVEEDRYEFGKPKDTGGGVEITKVHSLPHSGELVIPESLSGKTVVKIGDNVFKGLTDLVSVVLPNTVRVIGESAFKNSGLESIQFGLWLSQIKKEAFAGCAALTSVKLPDNLKYIHESAFKNAGLTSIDFGTSVEQIYQTAFQGTKLTSIILPNSLTYLGSGAFADTELNSIVLSDGLLEIKSSCFARCKKLTSLVIPNSVKWIGTKAFSGTGLSTLSLGNSLLEIGDSAFEEAELTSVIIPESVTDIGDEVFLDNPLKSVVIGSSVVNIGQYAFNSNGFELTSVTVLAETPPSVYRYSFPEATYFIGTLSVPEGCESIYKSADVWKLFSNVDVTTGIRDIPVDMGSDEGRTPIGSFGLDGRPVDDSYRGIVIPRYSDGTTTKGLRR